MIAQDAEDAGDAGRQHHRVGLEAEALLDPIGQEQVHRGANQRRPHRQQATQQQQQKQPADQPTERGDRARQPQIILPQQLETDERQPLGDRWLMDGLGRAFQIDALRLRQALVTAVVQLAGDQRAEILTHRLKLGRPLNDAEGADTGRQREQDQRGNDKGTGSLRNGPQSGDRGA